MKLNELEARLPALYYSALEDGGPSSLHLPLRRARGKTSIFKRFAKLMKRI